mgnify:CR=1 FL=1
MYTYNRPSKKVVKKRHSKAKFWLVLGLLVLVLAVIFPKYFEALFFYSLDGLFVPTGIIGYLIIVSLWFGDNRRW